MKTNIPKFITIEGCEGVGKSTQIALLKDYCKQNAIDAVFTREPGGTLLAEKIRAIILDPSSDIADLTELLLYAASRAQHVNDLIAPSLSQGKTVFCDRYSDSTIAYQAYGRGLPLDTVEKICEISGGGVTIDKTIFLDLDPQFGFARIKTRGQADRLELAGLEFHNRVYAGFKALAQKYSNRIISIDASQSAERVHKDIVNKLKFKNEK